MRAARCCCVETLHEIGDRAAVGAAVRELCESFLSQLNAAVGGIELIELIHAGTKTLGPVATWLAATGYAAEAFVLTQVTAGWLSHAMTEDASLIDDYDALHEALATKDDASRTALYAHMERRMLADQRTSTQVTGELPSIVATPDTAFVQFINGGNLWAVVLRAEPDGAQRHTSVALNLSGGDVKSLAVRIWQELRPSRGCAPAHGGVRAAPNLATLHDEVIAPLLPVLEGAREVVFLTTGELASLPLHAARGPRGHLVEWLGVRYAPTLWNDRGPGGPDLRGDAARTVIIGGWDPEINAPEEARAVSQVLQDFGYATDKVRNAVSGRQALLDVDRRRKIVHIAAHGKLEPWPQASNSLLQLSASVQITAREVMHGGCRPVFAFLNACGLGNVHLQAGDLHGFPLALRVRGARGSVTALGDILPAAAHRFATSFYLEFTTADTFRAYLRTVGAAIDEGAHVSSWAPYVYVGDAVSASTSPATPRPARRQFRRSQSRSKR
ncbi:putative PE-PGRS family protein [Kutzneria sp. 744]|nr:putative PE-PGRS family protein [Kutzneria sp. 744]